MKKHFIKKTFSLILCAALVSGSLIIPEKTSAADTDTTGWRNSIALDFGICGDGSDLDSTMKFNEVEYIPEISAEDCAEILKEGHGNYLYDKTTIKDIYGSDAADTQHIGFNKVLPAAKTTEGGNYFKDWVFSPDGEKYSFSADLPVGQYYVYVYTGNKTKAYGNTTIVNFANEIINDTPLNYDQTSTESRQFYGNDDNKANPYCVYVIDIKDNGSGYGTLTAYFSDDTIGNENYANSHQISIGAALDDIAADIPDEEGNSPGKALGIQAFDFYNETEDAIDSSAIKDSIVTARLNGIEIIPVAEPVHASSVTTPESMLLEEGQTENLEVNSGVSSVTDRISYISSNPQVADVDMYSGKVTANQIGTADIYAYNAYLNEFSITKVSVIPERVVSLDKTNISISLDENSENTAELTASFNVAEEDVIEWSSSDENIASISEAAFTAGDTAVSKVTITAKKAGEATITAKRKDVDKTATCTVNVKVPVSSVAIADTDNNAYADDAALTVAAGKSIDIKAIVAPENATVKDVSFSSSNNSIARVTADGAKATIDGVSEGEAVITVVSSNNPDISDTITVTVTPGEKTPDTPSAPSDSGQPSSGTATSGANADNNAGTVTSDSAQTASVSLSGKKTSSLKIKKSITFKAKAPGSKVKSVKVKIKSGKKLIKIKKSAKKVKITALKKGTAKLIITVKSASGASKKFKRNIKIK